MAPKIAVVYVSTPHLTCPSYLVYISWNEPSFHAGHTTLLHIYSHNVLQ